MPDVEILITNRLHDNGTPLLAVLVLPSKPLWARGPLPVRAIEAADASRHAPCCVALQHALDLLVVRRPQVDGLPLLNNKLNQLLGGHLNCRLGQPDILIRTIVRLPVREDTEGGHQLLQSMSLWPPCRIDALPPKWPVADGLVNAHKNRPWHTEATLERPFSVHRRLPIHTKIIPHDAAHTLVEITWPVGTPPGHRPDKTPSARSLRRIPAMTAHQEQRARSNDGRKQLVGGALRLPAAVIARRPRRVIS